MVTTAPEQTLRKATDLLQSEVALLLEPVSTGRNLRYGVFKRLAAASIKKNCFYTSYFAIIYFLKYS
jgi:hypothetical protein